jgi:hypothetical protein
MSASAGLAEKWFRLANIARAPKATTTASTGITQMGVLNLPFIGILSPL